MPKESKQTRARRELYCRQKEMCIYMDRLDFVFFTFPSMKNFAGPFCSTAPLLQARGRIYRGKKEKDKIQPIQINAQLSITFTSEVV